MPRIKIVHVGPTATSNESINLHPNNRGVSHPSSVALPAEPEPVSKVPYHQHTYADGTVAAPSWSPVEHDNTDLSNTNRSWDDAVRQLNPFGDPTHPRKARENFDLPAEPVATVEFKDGRKTVTHPAAPATPHWNNSSWPRPVSGPRTRVVGQPKNPVATLKPYGNG